MCTLAGYVGDERAAPILLEMIRREEGLWSGFYSGLVSASDDDLHWEKVVGTFAKLTDTTGVAELPGKIGLVHSRTKSGGDVEWGHPFFSGDGVVAGVDQGSSGIFKDSATRVALGDELRAAGCEFRTATPGTIGSYPTLSDGSAIHTSELNTQAVAVEYAQCGDPCEAIRRVTTRIPSEAVFAYLFRDRQDQLFIANVNQRIVFGRNETGTFFASSALALPEDAHWRMEMPGNTLAVVERNGVTLHSLCGTAVLPVDERLPPRLDATVLAFLEDNPRSSLGTINGGAVVPLWSEGQLQRRSLAIYATVERLVAAGLATSENEDVPGVLDGETAPRTVFSLQPGGNLLQNAPSSVSICQPS